MRTFLASAVSAILTAIVIVWLFGSGRLAGPSMSSGSINIDLTYSDLIAVLLTTLTIILGLSGLGLAILAFKTKAEIAADAKKTATQVAKAEVENTVSEMAQKEVKSSLEESLPRFLQESVGALLSDPKYSDRLDEILKKAFAQDAMGQTTRDEEFTDGK